MNLVFFVKTIFRWQNLLRKYNMGMKTLRQLVAYEYCAVTWDYYLIIMTQNYNFMLYISIPFHFSLYHPMQYCTILHHDILSCCYAKTYHSIFNLWLSFHVWFSLLMIRQGLMFYVMSHHWRYVKKNKANTQVAVGISS